MSQFKNSSFSRRERQIMDILFESPELSARDIHAALPDAPSYSAVRALLAILVEKGHAKFRSEGAKHVYSPVESMGKVRANALQRLLKTFFGGSTVGAVSALLGMDSSSLNDEELDALASLIEKEQAKRK